MLLPSKITARSMVFIQLTHPPLNVVAENSVP
ncbi:hypothetical protein C8N30_1746 [Sulfitobacter guttiformis]|uniref:Uncharacterized protein n=1 Tax=Sulfitobacter guttiformis TaxID=74349 RepID=A0A420DSL4_9RHOB|nr:hypothetical protein C8N30_1746 [Sulfitobacter guttiformis]